ncbi:retrovirus-related Pol polyprotein from transposon 412 [Trichonephila clavipes]|nr:retrovirus-related Pol polyprotein from transposon 412 [Trichonephila clavipes]
MREIISLQYFVDGLKEGEIQKAVRMADVQDLTSTLLYALNLEATTQASRKESHSIPGARVTADEPCNSRLIKEMENLKDEMEIIKAGISNQEKCNFKCWGSGDTGHLRRNCPRARKEENTVSSSKQEKKFRFGLIDYLDPDNSKGGVPIVSSVVDLSKSVIPVRVATINDKTRTIQEGEVIAACAPVTCVDRKCNTQDLPSEDLVKDLLQNTDLNEKQRCAARGLIKEFQSLFSKTSEDFGRTRLTKQRIDTGEHPPIKQHPDDYHSLNRRKKKDDSTRYCGDYRRLNDVTKKDSFPLPKKRIDDTLETLVSNTLSREMQILLENRKETSSNTSNSPPNYNTINIGIGPME